MCGPLTGLFGTIAAKVGQASLPAGSRGIPAPCSRFRRAGHPPVGTGGKYAAPSHRKQLRFPLTHFAKNVSENTKRVPDFTHFENSLTKLPTPLRRGVTDLTEFVNRLTKNVSHFTNFVNSLTKNVSRFTQTVNRLTLMVDSVGQGLGGVGVGSGGVGGVGRFPCPAKSWLRRS